MYDHFLNEYIESVTDSSDSTGDASYSSSTSSSSL
jgi:hypothetical protein